MLVHGVGGLIKSIIIYLTWHLALIKEEFIHVTVCLCRVWK